MHVRLIFKEKKKRSGVLVKMKSEKVVHAHKKGAPETKGYIYIYIQETTF